MITAKTISGNKPKRQYTRRTATTRTKRPGITVDPATLKPQPRPDLPSLSPAVLNTLADAIDLILS